MKLNEFTEILIDFYNKNTKRDKLKISVEYVDDIYNLRLELAVDDKDKNDVILNKEFIINVNGTIVMPIDNKGVFYILVSNKMLENYNFCICQPKIDQKCNSKDTT